MNEDKVQLQHPEGKKLSRVDKKTYDLIRAEILKILASGEEIKPMALLGEVSENLKGKLEGNIAWYAEGVKLDMETKKELVHDRKRGSITKPEGQL